MGTTRRRFPEECKRETVHLAAQPRMTISGGDLLAEHDPTWREARAGRNELPLSSELWRECARSCAGAQSACRAGLDKRRPRNPYRFGAQ